MAKVGFRAAITAALLAAPVSAQTRSEATCDSIIAASVIEQVPSGLFLSLERTDGGELSSDRATRMVLNIGAAFTAPKPFKLNVFAGSPVMRSLRSLSSATSENARVPTLTGVYRLLLTARDTVIAPTVLRQALMPGFDSAAVEAIAMASAMRDIFAPAAGEDSVRIDVTFATDSLPGARRLAAAAFPRLPVVDAVPSATNRPAVLPPNVEVDSSGPPLTVILRFVVTRDGVPAAGTVEVRRAPSVELLRAALEALVDQRFQPATIKGCPVAQQVDYPFVFARP